MEFCYQKIGSRGSWSFLPDPDHNDVGASIMAAYAPTTGAPTRASAIHRRSFLGSLAALPTVAVLPAASAAEVWSASDWIDRWSKLGCGLEVGGNALHLKGRLNGDRAAIGALMVEVAPHERQTAVIETMERYNAHWRPIEDPALRVVREMEAIDAEFVSEDDDPVANAAWQDRWTAAFDKLPWAPATTGEGRAAKLRYAIEYAETPRGDALLQQVLRYLEVGA